MSKNEGNQKLKFFKPSDLAWNAGVYIYDEKKFDCKFEQFIFRI